MEKLIFIFLSFVVLCSSCADSNIVFAELQEIDSTAWTYDDGVRFTIPITDTSQYYDFNLRLDHSPDFDFENVYINIESTFPSGEKKTDLLSLQLADKMGNWIGKCNSSECSTPFQLIQNMRFSSLGDHSFLITQHARQDSLSGLSGLGIELMKID